MRKISLNARLQHDEAYSSSIEAVLLKFSHGDLDQPIRLSTDPTEFLSADPLAYGTKSRWGSDDGLQQETYSFVVASALLPDDVEEAGNVASIMVENIGHDMVEILRSITDRAKVDMAVVLVESADDVEAEWRGLELVGFDGDTGAITLQISGEDLYLEPWPSARMTKSRFPGLFK